MFGTEKAGHSEVCRGRRAAPQLWSYVLLPYTKATDYAGRRLMMDVLIFMAGGVTAAFIAWLVKPIFGGLIEGMNGGTSRRKNKSE